MEQPVLTYFNKYNTTGIKEGTLIDANTALKVKVDAATLDILKESDLPAIDKLAEAVLEQFKFSLDLEPR